MTPTPPPAFDLQGTYVHFADDGGAIPIAVTEQFWGELIAGERDFDGRLVTAFEVSADAPAWERHPAGDELLYLVSGAVEVILELPTGEQRIALGPQTACIVPRGVWHRFVVGLPGVLVFVTPGAGTEHRPVAPTP